MDFSDIPHDVWSVFHIYISLPLGATKNCLVQVEASEFALIIIKYCDR